MIIHFDGGLRKNLMSIVVESSGWTKINKRKYDNDDYEWDALEMALDEIEKLGAWYTGEITLVGDNNQVIRWIQKDTPETDSVVKQKCLEKLTRLREHRRIIGIWVKRHENLAGRALEYWTRRSSKPTEFLGKWYSCSRCAFRSLSDKERSEHFYNEHITNG